MTRYALTVALVLASLAPLRSVAAHAQSTDDLELRVSHATLDRVFIEIRAAEITGDANALASITRVRSEPAVGLRIALALEAVRLRAAAHSAHELADAETTLTAARVALAASLTNDAAAAIEHRACARELLLESAEDLLLRRMAADASDARLAIGLTTSTERAAASTALSRAREILDAPLTSPLRDATATASTDPAAFRTLMLTGLLRLMEGDLARQTAVAPVESGEATTTRDARELLERAARTELPLPRAVLDVLALARARATNDPALRTRLLAETAASHDEALSLVARVEQWRDTRATRPFPQGTNADSPLALLAACAEARARAENGEQPAALTAPFERVLRQAQSRDATERSGSTHLAATARSIADRLNTALVNAAQKTDAPPLLVALALLEREDSPAGMRLSDDVLARATRAAHDALIAPWFAVAFAQELHARGGEHASDAIEVLEWLVANTPASASTRAALDIVIDERRRESRSDAANEAQLDAALALALTQFPTDAARDAWLLERVDLALFPRSADRVLEQDLDRAATTLLSVSTAAPFKEFRDLRALEIEFARLPDAPRDADADIRLCTDLLRRAKLLDLALQPSAAAQAATPAALVRLDALRAAATLRCARPTEAKVIAVRALRGASIDEAAAARAARTWITASLTHGQTLDPPSELLTFASKTVAVQDALREPVAAAAAELEAAMLSGDLDAHASAYATRTEGLATLALIAPRVAPREIQHAVLLARLFTADTPDARAKSLIRARRLVAEDAADRRSQWLLAETLRASTDAAATAEAFALLRDLAPISAETRDTYWWRAQLAQLEMLAAQPQRAADIVARVNRLAVLDENFGDTRLTKRFRAVRAAALELSESENDTNEATPREP